MQPAATASTRGILDPREGRRHFRLTRERPSPDLATWVERHWMVEWDLERPYTQELLNHPTINVAVEPAFAGVYGIRNERDRKTIAGAGRVVGVKFRPGAFQPFYGRSDAPADEPGRAAVGGLRPGWRRARARRARGAGRAVRGDGGLPARAEA